MMAGAEQRKQQRGGCGRGGAPGQGGWQESLARLEQRCGAAAAASGAGVQRQGESVAHPHLVADLSTVCSNRVLAVPADARSAIRSVLSLARLAQAGRESGGEGHTGGGRAAEVEGLCVSALAAACTAPGGCGGGAGAQPSTIMAALNQLGTPVSQVSAAAARASMQGLGAVVPPPRPCFPGHAQPIGEQLARGAQECGSVAHVEHPGPPVAEALPQRPQDLDAALSHAARLAVENPLAPMLALSHMPLARQPAVGVGGLTAGGGARGAQVGAPGGGELAGAVETLAAMGAEDPAAFLRSGRVLRGWMEATAGHPRIWELLSAVAGRVHVRCMAADSGGGVGATSAADTAARALYGGRLLPMLRSLLRPQQGASGPFGALAAALRGALVVDAVTSANWRPAWGALVHCQSVVLGALRCLLGDPKWVALGQGGSQGVQGSPPPPAEAAAAAEVLSFLLSPHDPGGRAEVEDGLLAAAWAVWAPGGPLAPGDVAGQDGRLVRWLEHHGGNPPCCRAGAAGLMGWVTEVQLPLALVGAPGLGVAATCALIDTVARPCVLSEAVVAVQPESARGGRPEGRCGACGRARRACPLRVSAAMACFEEAATEGAGWGRGEGDGGRGSKGVAVVKEALERMATRLVEELPAVDAADLRSRAKPLL